MTLAPGRPLPPWMWDDTARETVERWARRPQTAHALALRARMIWACAAGRSHTAVGAALGVSGATGGQGRARVGARRRDGLSDAPRSGRPRSVTAADVARGITLTLETVPQDATHGSPRARAPRCGLSHHPVRRLGRACGWPLHRTEICTWSSDPDCIEQGRASVGLDRDPPARVLCGDAKSPSPAWDRTRPRRPLRPGPGARRTHDSLRHGTVSLCAARDASTGTVMGRGHRRHRSVALRKFLDTLAAAGPPDLDVPSDRGPRRPPHDGADPARVGPTAPLPPALHPDPRVVVAPGGALVCVADGEATAPGRAPE